MTKFLHGDVVYVSRLPSSKHATLSSATRGPYTVDHVYSFMGQRWALIYSNYSGKTESYTVKPEVLISEKLFQSTVFRAILGIE